MKIEKEEVVTCTYSIQLDQAEVDSLEYWMSNVSANNNLLMSHESSNHVGNFLAGLRRAINAD